MRYQVLWNGDTWEFDSSERELSLAFWRSLPRGKTIWMAVPDWGE